MCFSDLYFAELDKIVDFVLIQENTGLRKAAFFVYLTQRKFHQFVAIFICNIHLKNQCLQIYISSHYCKYCAADAENNKFLLKLS